ncbi:glutaredoxin family protein [Propionicicella superfundia]|uniref:glutaredoxin family protein n=1 Tax=Propionicicella superfundia TaxID=348582 RepID=UPI00041A4DFC|nr:glutaredoxin family protein [Propionicicella superfundia]
MAAGPRVVLYVRAGCHLCADAEDVCARVCAAAGVEYLLVDVDSDPHLRALHSDHVPVAVVDGDVLSRWFLDPDALTAALAR